MAGTFRHDANEVLVYTQKAFFPCDASPAVLVCLTIANSYTTVSDKIRYDQSFERSGVAFTARPIGAPPKTIPERYAQVLSKGPTLFKGVPYVLCHVPNFVRITHSTAI